jgi:predicted transcriptional regulator
MLGIRLNHELERRLAGFARKSRRTKSDIARDAVEEYLRRHANEDEFRRQVARVAGSTSAEELEFLDDIHADLMRDEPDYDWGREPS